MHRRCDYCHTPVLQGQTRSQPCGRTPDTLHTRLSVSRKNGAADAIPRNRPVRPGEWYTLGFWYGYSCGGAVCMGYGYFNRVPHTKQLVALSSVYPTFRFKFQKL